MHVASIFLSNIVFWILIQFCTSHVRLYFPPARKPELDFLDNLRTGGPCGMIKPLQNSGVKTTIVSGSKINVTWVMAYSHIGGFEIELLDDKDEVMALLTPPGGVTSERTMTNFEVQIPANFECSSCAIRLTRDAKEWGEKYKFWSCGDVDIVKHADARLRCSNHGTETDEGLCRCERLHSGQACECKDECWSSDDCGANGACKFLTSASFPNWACFCKPGWFGQRCDQQSPINRMPNFAKHKSKQINSSEKIYWKLLPESKEIEIAVQFSSHTWVAIGWRPINTHPSCPKRVVKNLQDPAESIAFPEPDVVTEPEPNGEDESQPPFWLGAKITISREQKESVDSSGINSISDQCLSDWKWPLNCSTVYSNCDYSISWAADSDVGEVVFVLEAKTPQFGWSGIGFSSTGQMSGADMIIVKNQNGQLTLEDHYSPGYMHPRQDTTQNVYYHKHNSPAMSYVNGVLRAEFKRLLSTGDFKEDAQFSTNCFYFLYPTFGGRLSLDGIMDKHNKTPKVSDSPICFNKCSPSKLSTKTQTSANENIITHQDFLNKIDSIKAEPEPAPRSISYLHPMDCTDIVIGLAKGNFSRITDSYTISRSTPQADEVYGGMQSLTAAYGHEEDGLTTMVFRKPLLSIEATDYSFVDEPMHIIWAKGQVYTDLELQADRLLAAYYEPDVLKYHGRGNRGTFVENFYG